MLLNNKQITEEIKKEIKICLKQLAMKTQLKFMGFSKSSSKREVYSNTILPQKTIEPLINNLTLHLKKLEKKLS